MILCFLSYRFLGSFVWVKAVRLETIQYKLPLLPHTLSQKRKNNSTLASRPRYCRFCACSWKCATAMLAVRHIINMQTSYYELRIGLFIYCVQMSGTLAKYYLFLCSPAVLSANPTYLLFLLPCTCCAPNLPRYTLLSDRCNDAVHNLLSDGSLSELFAWVWTDCFAQGTGGNDTMGPAKHRKIVSKLPRS